MSRPPSTSSIRVGAQGRGLYIFDIFAVPTTFDHDKVYQISLTPAQLEQRHVDKQRERRISRETSKRRKALEDRRKQTQLREERERQNELMKRRERQREATERYQRRDHYQPFLYQFFIFRIIRLFDTISALLTLG